MKCYCLYNKDEKKFSSVSGNIDNINMTTVMEQYQGKNLWYYESLIKSITHGFKRLRPFQVSNSLEEHL